jgi:hypothetical protein
MSTEQIPTLIEVPAEAHRWRDAVAISHGAVNIGAMARSLISAQNEVHVEGGNTHTDEAIRLIIHQMAYVAKVRELDTSLIEYQHVLHLCEDKANA